VIKLLTQANKRRRLAYFNNLIPVLFQFWFLSFSLSFSFFPVISFS